MSLHSWDVVQFMLIEDSAGGPVSDTNLFNSICSLNLFLREFLNCIDYKEDN